MGCSSCRAAVVCRSSKETARITVAGHLKAESLASCCLCNSRHKPKNFRLKQQWAVEPLLIQAAFVMLSGGEVDGEGQGSWP